ncbi:hypothetical protein SNEBB_000550 [Seison nebaliae]|nr:hypothetical protein SNEBB_000550 [Seison nebaliae]
MNDKLLRIRQLLKLYGQEHLLRFYDELNSEKKEYLLNDINSINFSQYFHETTSDVSSSKSDGHLTPKSVKLIDEESMSPMPDDLVGSMAKETKEKKKIYEKIGLEAIARNEVATILLAGGQGTRLGVNYPKGMFNVDLPSEKTLFQLQSEKLLYMHKLASMKLNVKFENISIPWYIMTSEATQEKTSNFFEKNNFFGLKKENVKFFEQNTLPCLGNDGKIILNDKHKIARAPDGNGGVYSALINNNYLDDMEKRGVKYVYVYCVDNILVKMVDPIFIGFAISKNSNCAAKYVKKIQPTESVGVLCQVNNRAKCVEYSEISLDTASKRNPSTGDLVYSAGNICIHLFTRQFLNELTNKLDKLPSHLAKKKVPFINEMGEKILPKTPNGIKFEKYIFDIFPFSNCFALWEVLREDEFSPLKNSSGDFSPVTARRDLMHLHYRWLLQSECKFKYSYSPDGSPIPHIQKEEEKNRLRCEVSPLISYNGENLESVKGMNLTPPIYLEMVNNEIMLNAKSLNNSIEESD